MKSLSSNVKLFIYGGGALCILLIGLAYLKFSTQNQFSCTTEMKLINPEMACGKELSIDKTNYISLKHDIEKYIESQKNIENIASASIYFRDLEYGPVFGINEDEDFAPASLLKLPLAIMFYQTEESGISILDQVIQSENIPIQEVQTFMPKVSAQPHVPYSIRTLISYMLSYSDNAAYQMLIGYLNGQSDGVARMLRVFHQLGILDPRSDAEDSISVNEYASLFRLLYNASYLNKSDSNEILSLLAESDFGAGITAGVPRDVIVSHKFGEREVGGFSPVHQLHDCGIVYFPKNPYLLCIMTKGKDVRKLTQVLQSISEMVYAEVKSREQ